MAWCLPSSTFLGNILTFSEIEISVPSIMLERNRMKPLKTILAAALIVCSVLTVAVLAAGPELILGKTDINALLEAAPGLPSSTAEAATRAYGPDIRMNEMPIGLTALYQPFYERVAAVREQFKEAARSRLQGMPSQAATEKQAKEQANANPMVAGMGGVDKIEQMTPEQRQQAGRQAAENYKQSLITGGGRNSPGMQAMMQKVMNDPEYRARFQKMSDQEKEAEMRKFMGNAPPTAPTQQTPAEQQQAQERTQTKNDVTTAMAIRSELSQMVQRMGEIDATFAKKDLEITHSPGNHTEIAGIIAAKVAKVPIVELGEYGKDRDPELMKPLMREEATLHRDRAGWELKQRSALHAQRKAQYKALVVAYQAWLKQNQGRINASMTDMIRGTNTEIGVAGYEEALVGLSETLAKYTEEVTKDVAHYERNYREKVESR